jgi:hypothetical protein
MSKPEKSIEPGYDEDWTVLYEYQNIAGVPEMIERFERQEQGLVSFEADLRLVQQAALVLFFSVYDLALREMEQSHTRYLALPAAIGVIEREESYRPACAVGRLWYRLSQHEVNEETGKVERVPVIYSRQELFEDIASLINPTDTYLAATTSLVSRVGYCVGWLSGLSASQPDDVQAVMVMLAALVKPLLLGEAFVQREVKLLGKKVRAKKLPARARSGRK